MTTHEPRTISTGQHRTVGFRTLGSEAGRAVMLCHSAPGSSAFDPQPPITAGLGVRLITVDRPGYGASTPLAGTPSIGAFAEDLIAVLDHLEVESAPLVGWSAGGRVALAAASRHPGRVPAVATVGTPAPHDQVPWIPDEQAAMLDALRSDPEGAVSQLAGIFGGLASEASTLVGMLAGSPVDSRLLEADADLAQQLDSMLRDATVQGAIGMAADIVSYTLVPWGFDPADVPVPTTNFSGTDDPVVPPSHAAWYTSRMPYARQVVVEGAGHLLISTGWDEILSAVLS